MDCSPDSLPETTPLNGQLLVVEDHQDLARVLAIALSRADYAVQTAASVAQAKEHLKDNAVDLVITDWQLPDGTGADVCVAAREVDRFMPVIVVSAVISRQEVRNAGCPVDAYLEKPVDLHTLRVTVRRLLDLAAGSGSI